MNKAILILTVNLLTGCAQLHCRDGVWLPEMYGYKGGYCMKAGEPRRKPDMPASLDGAPKSYYGRRAQAISRARSYGGHW